MRSTAAMLVVGVCSLSAVARPITGADDVALVGGTCVDFESEVVGMYYAYQGGYTSSVGHVNFYAPRLYIDANSRIAGLYNTRGARYLANWTPAQWFTMTFASPVEAFGFHFGASDIGWTLTAYDAQDRVIEAVTIPPTHMSNAGDFFGIAAPGIASATLAQGPGLRTTDAVFVDDLTFR